MSRRGRNPRSTSLELRLNLSPQRAPSSSSSSAHESSENSTSLVSEMTVEESEAEIEVPGTRAMLLVGCPRCLMYVLLSQMDPMCPKCNSTVLLDFLNEQNTKSKSKTNNTNN